MVGLGTWKLPKESTSALVYQSIKDLGVRHLDCACDYGNEVEVGLGINKAITEGIVKREDLWITSKLWNTYHEPENVAKAFQKSLADLNLNYIDLYLIHFPISMKFVPIEKRYPPEWIYDPDGPNPKIEQIYVPLQSTWEAMEDLVAKGVTRHIGISNFNAQLVMELLSFAKVMPHSNQIELHPYLTQQSLVNLCHSKGIKTTALSPLGSPSYIELGMDGGLGNGILEDPVVTTIAAAHSKTPAQIILRWNVQRGCSIIPKSCKLERIRENFAVMEFTLSEEEMATISALNRNMRFNDPGVFCIGMGGSIPIYA